MKLLGIDTIEDNVFLESSDGVLIENDDGIEYCLIERLTILFKLSSVCYSSDTRPTACPKPWPLTYLLPKMNDLLVNQIESAGYDNVKVSALKNNISFCSSFLNAILNDIEQYLDENK